MGSLIRHGLVLGACLAATVASSGCTAKKQTEYVGGISTQLQVPRDVKSVRVRISVGGSQVFCQGYNVYNGIANLPRSLGSYAVNDTTQSIRYEIAAVSEDYADGSNNSLYSVCDVAEVGKNSVRLLRSSTQPYIPERILFLPLPLKYACYDVSCPDGQTCKGGVCAGETMSPDDAKTLPDFVDGMGDGTDGGCFSAGLCMGAAIPAIPLGTTSTLAGSTGCDFVLPETADSKAMNLDPAVGSDPFRPTCKADSDCNGGTLPADASTARKCGTTTAGICDLLPQNSPSWSGINVQVSFDGGRTSEILDNDPIEGFTIPDPTKPQTFRLAPGLCAMYQGAAGTTHRITGVRASGSCGAKTAAQSICHDDALALQGLDKNGTAAPFNGTCTSTPLTPTAAALVAVIDDTKGNAGFFDKNQIQSFRLPLTDPAFGNTQVGMIFAPGADSAQACSAARDLDQTFESAVSGANDIAAKLTAAASTLQNGDPSFDGALASAYHALDQKFPTILRRGVIVVGNRQFTIDNKCAASSFGGDTPNSLALKKFAGGAPISTFVLELADPQDPNGAKVLAGAGLGGIATIPYEPTPPDATSKLASFQTIVDQLATCAYDLPLDAKGNVTSSPAIPQDDGKGGKTPADVLSYVDPLTNTQQPHIAYNAACNHDALTNVDGWGLSPDGKHVFVCGNSCSQYRDVAKKASAFALTYNQPSLSVPLYYSADGCTK